MRLSSLQSLMVFGFLALVLLGLWGSGVVWAAPSQSPARQTVPTRGPSPTSVPTQIQPTVPAPGPSSDTPPPPQVTHVPSTATFTPLPLTSTPTVTVAPFSSRATVTSEPTNVPTTLPSPISTATEIQTGVLATPLVTETVAAHPAASEGGGGTSLTVIGLVIGVVLIGLGGWALWRRKR